MTAALGCDEVGLLDRVPTRLYVGGQWIHGSDSSVFDVTDPATGQILASVADATPEDGLAALTAASDSQQSWAATPPRVRAEILRRAFELVTAQTEDFALLMTLEMGKPLSESRAEVAYGAEFLRWFSEETVRIAGRYTVAPDGANRLLVTKRPVGPCLLITPWNFPLAMATRKIAPAIAAGCTMVLKPADLTPLTALFLAAVMEEAGVPPGVLNVVPTSNASALSGPLLADPRLRKLSFTGSTAVGRRLIVAAAENVLKVSMELGGNAPFLVFDDADLGAAIEGALAAKLRNGGEACVAANRFLVHAAVADAFTEQLTRRMASCRVARGTEPDATLGPLISDAARHRVHALVNDALAAGARLATGGVTVAGPGYFYQPTVLVDVPPSARIMQEEIFGPVAPITTFTTESEAITLANATPYGLVCFAYTSNLERTLRLAEQLETGMLGINTGVVSNPAAPFGGVKQSGLGREGGAEGIEEYLETTYIGVADPYSSRKER